MCMVSMVMDTAAKFPAAGWTLDTWQLFNQVLRRLDELDRKLGQPDCHDPRKAEWMRSVEERLRCLEEAATSPVVSLPVGADRAEG